MKIVEGVSHLDHALTAAHQDLILQVFGDRAGFFAETIKLPFWFDADLVCALHGPAMGDESVSNAYPQQRGNRAGKSMVVDRAPRMTRLLTVIGGPHKDEPCILFTAYGGPLAPQEPFDLEPDAEAYAASCVFWLDHALSSEKMVRRFNVERLESALAASGAPV